MDLNITLHEKQGIALESPATEILYGGAAGGGKSHLMRVAAIIWASQIAGLQVYLFRRKRGDLIINHMNGPTGFRSLLAPWTDPKLPKAPNGKPVCSIIEDEIRFYNGSIIHLCHCKDEKDRFNYQGAEIHVLLIDELTHFSEVIYTFLRGRMRKPTSLEIPAQYANKFPCALLGANPGNIGHLWVKQAFIDNADSYDIRQMSPDDGGMHRVFIPARLDDNPSLDYADYAGKLKGLGSAELVRAMLDGDWDVIEGAFFDCWDANRHVTQPFSIPQHWVRFRSMDWGSAKPFSVGWWAVASDDYRADGKAGPLIIPRGALVRYREWYGASKPNVGLKIKNAAIAAGILEREQKAGELGKITYGVLDSACFADNGGPSIYEQMLDAKLNGKTVVFRPTDSKQRVSRNGIVGGWDMMRSRLIGDDDGRAMIFCFSTCHDSIRTIPALQHDETQPEDLDSDMEDHAADEWRYACMSRPWVRPQPTPDKTKTPKDYRVAGLGEQTSWR